MVDAPERIWAYPDRGSQTYGGWDCAGDGDNSKYPRTEYVRADLYTRLQEQLEAVTRERTVSINDPREVEEANIRADLAIDRMHKAEARAARLEAAGAGLANAAYNLSQNDALPARDRIALRREQELWDAERAILDVKEATR